MTASERTVLDTTEDTVATEAAVAAEMVETSLGRGMRIALMSSHASIVN